MGEVRVGTCSWADKTMVEAWYPAAVKSAEERLRYYAQRFDTVEADSPFYAIPAQAVTRNWADRTPERFVFHVKAYGLMTQHAVDERSLGADLGSYPYSTNATGRVTRPSPEMVARSFELFTDAMQPLRAAGKMGGVLTQFPAFFAAVDDERRRANLAYIEQAHEMLDGLHMMVEFRHPSWLAEDTACDTLKWLSDRGITYVAVDAPQFSEGSTIPPVPGVTSPVAYLRLHGRNRDTYFKRVATAAERFDYLYTPEELQEWVPAVREMAGQAEVTYVMFNNCRYDYAPRNARQMGEILGDVARRPSGRFPGEPASQQESGSGQPETLF